MVYYCDLWIHLHNYIQLHIQTHKSTRPYGPISHKIYKYINQFRCVQKSWFIIMVMTKYIQRVDECVRGLIFT